MPPAGSVARCGFVGHAPTRSNSSWRCSGSSVLAPRDGIDMAGGDAGVIERSTQVLDGSKGLTTLDHPRNQHTNNSTQGVSQS